MRLFYVLTRQVPRIFTRTCRPFFFIISLIHAAKVTSVFIEYLYFITVTSQWSPWHLRSSVSRLFALTVCSGAHQRKHYSSASLVFVKGMRRWQRASNAESVSIWWRHHTVLGAVLGVLIVEKQCLGFNNIVSFTELVRMTFDIATWTWIMIFSTLCKFLFWEKFHILQ